MHSESQILCDPHLGHTPPRFLLAQAGGSYFCVFFFFLHHHGSCLRYNQSKAVQAYGAQTKSVSTFVWDHTLSAVEIIDTAQALVISAPKMKTNSNTYCIIVHTMVQAKVSNQLAGTSSFEFSVSNARR